MSMTKKLAEANQAIIEELIADNIQRAKDLERELRTRYETLQDAQENYENACRELEASRQVFVVAEQLYAESYRQKLTLETKQKI